MFPFIAQIFLAKPNFFLAGQCSEKNGGCEHECKPNGYKAICECYKGYKLANDSKGCELGKNQKLIF